ncbi:MAG: tRNA pseudouridine(55) synthase TruB, partial [Firmicutes bacterium]|nr:tRNA pseudouridine(55) synthase TruB [Bacillota bacterium]
MINGVVNLYKEKGYTSMDAIRVLSGILKERKVGHTGTLDPQAEGVLPVCLGKATKVAELIMGTDKTYIAKMKFGAETDTQDCWGQVVKEAAYTFDPAGFEAAVKSFEGGYNQVPPMYSALKHEGKKLYDLARRGMVIERESRFVRIDRIRILDADAEGASIEVACSKGTYIRSLCEDIGRKTGYLAHMTELVRTATGPYRIQDSLTL